MIRKLFAALGVAFAIILAQTGAGLRRGERLRLALVAPEAVHQGFWLGEQGLHRLAAARAYDVVGVLGRGKLDEAEGPLRREVGQGAQGRADRGLPARAVAVEAEDRRRIEPPHAL